MITRMHQQVTFDDISGIKISHRQSGKSYQVQEEHVDGSNSVNAERIRKINIRKIFGYWINLSTDHDFNLLMKFKLGRRSCTSHVR